MVVAIKGGELPWIVWWLEPDAGIHPYDSDVWWFFKEAKDA